MAVWENYKCEIGVEAAFGDGLGGGAFTPIPLTFDSIPELVDDPTTLPVIGGSKARQPSYPDGKMWKIPFKFYLKGSGTAGTASELGKLFRICGLDETVNAGVSVTYDPQDSGYESGTLKINRDGVQYLCAGTKGEVLKIPLIAGKRTICEGTLRSLYTEPTGVAYSAPTFADAAVSIPIVQSLGLTIGGNTHVIPEITFTLDMSVEPEPNVNAANDGINDWAYDIRNWTYETFLKRDATSDIEMWTKYGASTNVALSSTGYGSAGNIHEFDAANSQIISVKEVKRVGAVYYQVTAGFNYHATLASQFRYKQT